MYQINELTHCLMCVAQVSLVSEMPCQPQEAHSNTSPHMELISADDG